MSLLRDEQNKMSMARMGVALTTVDILVLGTAETFFKFPVSGSVWAILTAIEFMFVGWAGGARVMEYLGPHITSASSAIGALARKFGGSTADVDATKH